ncbi:MAG: hypothetical protein ACTHMC_23765 [Pseudobacter sp.]|uniref:hypothetical protein n=1 Tax=Pseudobacter sp. TaxID=2045420 RepID=UPI003F7ED7AB
MVLTSKAVQAIKDNVALKNLLALDANRSVHTIEARLNTKKKHVHFTTVSQLELIRKETGLTDDEILEREEAATGS